LGVGLTLVRAIIELHGGSITAHSDGPGQGSTFSFALPLVDVAGASHAHSQSSAAESIASTSEFGHLRIAIIEDNSDSRTTLQTLIELDGHEVRSASDGQAGVALVLNWRPDMALVDIGLPGLDGFEVAREIRSTLASSHNQALVKLIALTGYGLPSDRERILSSGFDAHLVKPLRYTELLSTLSILLKANSSDLQAEGGCLMPENEPPSSQTPKRVCTTQSQAQ
jgi:CheY-like chemotaxis protein